VVFAGFSTAACADEGADRPAGDTGERDGTAAATANTANRAKPRLVRVANFDQPVEIKSAPGYPRLMFVVEQDGRVMVLRRGQKLRKPFLDIRGRVRSGGEQGLLSIAFPSDYRRTKRFYVYYTDRTGDIRVVEFRRRTAVRARNKSARSVIRIGHRDASNHNGGQLQFLGNHLYFGTGDGGGGGDPDNNAQDRRSLLGKMIRLDPRAKRGRPYTVPRTNPFVGRRGQNEIYSTGLRNPYRWSFAKKGRTTRMMIADVGQDRFEELNAPTVRRARGGNFGWDRFEGFAPYEGAIRGTIKPAAVLPHSGGNVSIVGGLVVRDRKVPALRGKYIFTDFANGTIRTIPLKSGRHKPRSTGVRGSSITSFGESNSGVVYLTSLNGPVYRLKQ
jgi:glucose/arabinose dehydrogenase